MDVSQIWLEAVKSRARTDKDMAERAIAQLSDEELHRRIAPGVNSVAVIVRHLAGNMLSRWTDFLTTDGEKPTRNREQEFADWTGTRDELMKYWQHGFAAFFDTLDSLKPDDMSKTIQIRREPHSVPLAIVRGIDHLAYHLGQILLVARLVHSGQWKYVTIAPGGSAAYNRDMGMK
jgi:uncharacterized damage-inducible protein DinB